MPENTNNQDKENRNPSGFITDSGTGVVIKEEAEWRAVRHYREPQSSKMVRWAIQYSGGLVKNEKWAGYILLVFSGLFLVITVILLSSALGGSSKPPAGFRGNIPSTPEYLNPPRPEDFR